MSTAPQTWIHPTALVEEGARLGPGTKVWDNVHIRRGATLGRSCIVGEKSYIAYDVTIGAFVKLNAAVYVCAGVTIEDFVMVAAHVVLTNDRFPRAGDWALSGLETSDVTEETLLTRVCRGATIGANATIGAGLTLGEFSLVGMGSVVTRDVPSHWVVAGNPARRVGYACVCGQPMLAPVREEAAARVSVEQTLPCERCGRRFIVDDAAVHLTHDPFAA